MPGQTSQNAKKALISLKNPANKADYLDGIPD